MVIVVAVFVIANTLFILLFIPTKDVDISGSDFVAHEGDVEDLQLTFECNMMNLDITYLDMEDKLVDFEYSITGKVAYLAPEEIILDYSFVQSIEDESLNLTIAIEMMSDLLGAHDLDINGLVKIDNSLVSSIAADLGVGNIELQCPDDVVLEYLDLETTTGSMFVSIGDGAVVSGDVVMNTQTGSVQLIWENVDVVEDLEVSIRSNTGSIHVQIDQEQPLHSDVDFVLDNSVGKISLDIGILGSVGAEVISDTDVGGVNVNSSSGFSFTDIHHLRSDNYPGAHNFNISMHNGVGDIDIDAHYTPS